MEIVTAPDMRSAADAGLFVRRLQHLLRHIGTCDGNMQDVRALCSLRRFAVWA
jgi:aspartyl-tRNA(Asn)/glutamyl-tRNA(Gln) amidotransferase subunit B